MFMEQLNEAIKHKPRILVAAPSNAAVDNVIIKLMEEGFRDGNGHRYNPVICRCGANSSKNDLIKNIALSTYVDKYLRESKDPKNNISRLDMLKSESKGLLETCKMHIGRLRTLKKYMSGGSWGPISVASCWELYCHREHDEKESKFRGMAEWHNKKTKAAQVSEQHARIGGQQIAFFVFFTINLILSLNISLRIRFAL